MSATDKSEREEFVARRILVAVDASRGSLLALDAGARLAERLSGQLTGLFVEDEDLLRLARHPVAGHLTLPTGAFEALDTTLVEAQLRALASEARRALRAAAERCHVEGSFRVARGAVTRQLLLAAGEADLVVVGWSSRPLARRARLGRIARAVADAAPRAVLLWSESSSIASGLLLVAEQTPSSGRARAAAARLSQALEAELSVYALAHSEDAARPQADLLTTWLRERGLAGSVRVFRRGSGLRHALRGERDKLIVCGADSLALRREGETRLLLDELDGPVLLVR